MNRLLLCPPDFYSIRYEINPWMSLARDVDRAEAAAQWRQLRETLRSLDCEVELLSPEPDGPDMVFTANAGLAAGSRFPLGTFRHPRRQGETPSYERWFAEHGCEIVSLPTIRDVRCACRLTDPIWRTYHDPPFATHREDLAGRISSEPNCRPGHSAHPRIHTEAGLPRPRFHIQKRKRGQHDSQETQSLP